jgi:flagellum-specific peptidoglycan hydrolase FlgJ
MKGQGASAGQIRDAISGKIKGSAEYQELHASDTSQVAALPKTGNEVIDHYAEAAIEAQRKTGVPASLALAQLVQESGGSLADLSGLARDYHNLFGVKGSGPAGSVTLTTTEYDANGNAYQTPAEFARYHTDAESFEAHGELIAGTHPGWTPFYAEPWAQYQKDHDAYGLARGIASIYATDPNYADALVGIMQRYDLTRFDALA